MRKPEYISPSALKTWLDNEEEYYRRYLCPYRMPAAPQTKPMSIGSAFDAYVKSYLHRELFGASGPDADRYELTAIFEAQVELCNRDWAWKAGAYVFGAYKDSGALADLMFELQGAASEPRFEIAIKGVIRGAREPSGRWTAGVPLLGKPDVYFINGSGAHVILDWKVNGFCSRFNKSPMPGYKLVRDCHVPSRTGGTAHKDYIPMTWHGMEIDGGSYLESRDADWAAQLSTYGWILGEPVGTEIVTAIDQIVCQPKSDWSEDKYPYLRIAHHRSRVSQTFQLVTLAAYQELWGRVTEEPTHFFRTSSLEDSQARCQMLDEQARDLYGQDSMQNMTDEEAWLLRVSRS